MTSLGALVFFIPVSSGEKVTFGMSVLLAFSVFQLVIEENLPKTSRFMPRIGEFQMPVRDTGRIWKIADQSVFKVCQIKLQRILQERITIIHLSINVSGTENKCSS